VDLIAHAASGALLGRAARPTGATWPAFALYGAAAGLSPDIDAPLALAGADAWARFHQVATHSLVGLVWVPLALAALPFRFAPWRTRYALALAGFAVHVFLDVVARWPVPLLWPISDARTALYLLEVDFSWRLDMAIVTGLALSCWDPARRHARAIAAATALVLALSLALGAGS
jgi:membrane-bound metal-dependent hydrolase YbcI (DUF457 family)